MKEETHLSVDTENLAMPEIHLHADKANDASEKHPAAEDKKLHVKYDDLAVPEVLVTEDER